MFFYLQKLILHLLLPPASPLLLVLAGYLLYRKNVKKAGTYCMIAGIGILYLLSTSIVSNLLIRPLENDYPPLHVPPGNTHTIVILTAGAKDLSHIGIGPYPGLSSIARLEHAVELFGKAPADLFIISGGKGDTAKPDISIGRSLIGTARALGIPDDRLVIEDTSRNTFESAQEVRLLLNEEQQTLILVTSAFHMKRSVAFYEQAGFTVIPAPTDYKGEALRFNLFTFIPSSQSLDDSSTALYEYLCRIWYTFVT